MGGIQYVFWPGTNTRLTPWMLYCLQLLDADLWRLFRVRLSLDSSGTQRGIRTHQEQVNLFLSRYWQESNPNIKGPYNDVRWWNGKRYVRHSGLGTVAQPGTSNHEIQDDYYAAIDLADTGGAGIGTMGSARSNWLRANAANYGLQPEGFKFKEAWHYRVPDIFRSVPAGGGGSALPIPVPASERNSDMEYVYITDPEELAKGGIDGNGAAGWAVLNTAKPNLPLTIRNGVPFSNPVIMKVTDPNAQATADDWVSSLGTVPRKVTRQQWLALIELNRLTNG